ncbi:MAG: hypothetical protein L6R41_005572 [Letrouitia leprolyta]|nr:MAG: hypothetical protein L6R41_005572 [Letrouitia leprolyta]
MEVESSAELEHVRGYWARMKPKSPIYTFLLDDIVLVSATHGKVKAHLKVLPVHVNSKGTLHGLDNSGLSTDIHTTFVSTAQEGDLLEMVGKASKVGASLAFTTIEIRHAGQGGRVVAHGTHTKYVKAQ